MKSYAEQAVETAVQMLDLKGTRSHSRFAILGRRYERLLSHVETLEEIDWVKDEIIRRRPNAARIFEKGD